jgi:hypothetical protein
MPKIRTAIDAGRNTIVPNLSTSLANAISRVWSFARLSRVT